MSEPAPDPDIISMQMARARDYYERSATPIQHALIEQLYDEKMLSLVVLDDQVRFEAAMGVMQLLVGIVTATKDAEMFRDIFLVLLARMACDERTRTLIESNPERFTWNEVSRETGERRPPPPIEGEEG